MTRASRRLTSVAAALAVTLIAAAPAAAKPFLKLNTPTNEIAASTATRGATVYDFFWSPMAPPPFMIDMHSYLIVPGDDWSRGAPVDEGMLAAVVRNGVCQQGARYGGAHLRIGERTHYMRDILVTGCKPALNGEAQMMTMAFATVD